MCASLLQSCFNTLLVVACLLPFTHSTHAASFTKIQVIERLKEFNNSSPLLALINTQTERKIGDNEDTISSSSAIEVGIEYKEGVLSTRYSKNLLNRIKAEAKAHEVNPNVPTPTQNAVGRLNIRRIQTVVAAHEILIRRLNNATLIQQKSTQYKNKPATLMEFKVQPKLSKRDKKYIKKTQATMKLWVNSKGIPIACETDFSMRGRAFLVVSFKGKEEKKIEYQVSGNRLLATYQKIYKKNSGAGESGESTVITTLVLQ